MRQRAELQLLAFAGLQVTQYGALMQPQNGSQLQAGFVLHRTLQLAASVGGAHGSSDGLSSHSDEQVAGALSIRCRPQDRLRDRAREVVHRQYGAFQRRSTQRPVCQQLLPQRLEQPVAAMHVALDGHGCKIALHSLQADRAIADVLRRNDHGRQQVAVVAIAGGHLVRDLVEPLE